jgi:hypothetical protein
MRTSVLKLVYINNEILHVSANYVAIFRDVKYKGKRHVGVHCAYQLISIYLCVSVGTVVVYIEITRRSWTV